MTDLASHSVGSPSAPGPAAAAERAPRWWQRRWVPVVGEAVVSVGAASAYTLLCTRISVNPINRIGQVSGLAKLQEYVAVLGLPLLAILLFTAYRGSAFRHQLVKRLVCAALAGLATGVVAGGVVVALRGTPWPLGGQEGDPGVIMAMATTIMDGKGLPGVYPPGFPMAMAIWSDLFYGGRTGAGFALHDLQILFTALFGPMAYLSWRLVLRPFWALLIAVPASIVFLDPIRPYSHIVMVMLVPFLVAFFRTMGRIAGRRPAAAVLLGLAFGAAFGAMFLWYSGWFLWAAPGVLLLALFCFPWRRGRTARFRAALYVAGAGAGFAVVGSPLLYELAKAGGSVPDRYAFLAVYADPSYVLNFVSDRSGDLTYDTWPGTGDLAGQSGISVLLLLGTGLALGLALRQLTVRVAAAVLVSAWLMRFYYAGKMSHDRAVQLYPRTTWIILYCLMILAVFGLMALVNRGSGWGNRVLAVRGAVAEAIPRRVVRQVAAGMVCVLAVFGAMGAGWSINRYMPEDPAKNSMGMDAWRAHLLQKPNGKCPKYAPNGLCVVHEVKDRSQYPDNGVLWCAGIVAAEWPTVCGRKAPFDDLSTKPAPSGSPQPSESPSPSEAPNKSADSAKSSEPAKPTESPKASASKSGTR